VNVAMKNVYWLFMVRYIREHEVTSGESVVQCDNPNLDSVNIMADIVDIIKPELEYGDDNDTKRS
jgi:hypothetical protein